MNELEAIKLFKALSDKSRLAILKCLIIEDMYVELLSKRLSLSASTISFHLKKLEDAGAVSQRKEQYYTMYCINKDIFNVSLIDLINIKSSDIQIQKERQDNYEKKVIESFFKYGKLKSIPVQRKKEIIILKEIAKSFRPNKEYSEKEVNLIIADFHDDFCTIRRDMVSEKILSRNNGIYKLTLKEN